MTIEFRVDVPPPILIETDEEARELLYTLLNKVESKNHGPRDAIGFDTETNGKKTPTGNLDWMNDTITFWSLAAELDEIDHRWCLQQEHFIYFAPLLEHPKAWFADWNAKYDAHIAWNCGINVWNANHIDGLAMAGLHDENRREHGLKSCSADYLGLHMTPYRALFDFDIHGNKAKEFVTSLFELPIMKVADYASYDAHAHRKAVLWLMDRLIEAPINTDGGNLWEYFLTFERHITEVLWRMERRGMNIDIDYLQSKVPLIDEKINNLLKDINREAGKPINIDSPKKLAEFLFGKDGLGLQPVKMTKGGSKAPQPSTDKEVMAVLMDAGIEIAKKIIECRNLRKTKSTYIEALIKLANHFDDKRIHPGFNQIGARTGRFSTNDPNSQNFPNPETDEWGIRRAFIAPKGKKLIVSDYAQLEMRILADRSGDPTMIAAIKAGMDLHSFTAAELEGAPYEEMVAAKKTDHPDERQKVLKLLREAMKTIGFAIFYGAGAGKISEGITITDEEIDAKMRSEAGPYFEKKVRNLIKKNPLYTEDKARIRVAREMIAQDKIDGYFRVFPKVKEFIEDTPAKCKWLKAKDFWGNDREKPRDPRTNEYIEDGNIYDWDMDQWIHGAKYLTRTGHARQFGFVQTLLGRYRRLEDIDHRNWTLKGHAQREATNAEIQGTAADVVKGAMLRIEFNDRLNELGVEIINQIHDELVMEAPEENVEEASPIIQECMEHPFAEGEECLEVLLPVDLKVVDVWSAAK